MAILPTPRGPLTVYYDDQCDLCTWAVGEAVNRDRACRIRLRPVSVPGAAFPADDLARELHVVDAGGTVYRGYEAVVAIVSALPRLRPLARLLGARALARPGAAAYRCVARRRGHLRRRH